MLNSVLPRYRLNYRGLCYLQEVIHLIFIFKNFKRGLIVHYSGTYLTYTEESFSLCFRLLL